jgi:hypothetical protein
MWVAYSTLWCYDRQAPFHGAAQQNVSLFSLLLILATQNRSAQVVEQNSPYAIFAVIFLFEFVSFMGSKI